MRYDIDTIPVWDAVRAGTPCALCLLEVRSRAAALRSTLGPSVMVPEARVEANRRGFSPATLQLLARDPNKLGLGLLTHTRLKALRETFAALTRPWRKTGTARARELKAVSAFLRAAERGCLVEDKVQSDRERYAFTLVHLWASDPDFTAAWEAGPGLCLRHAADVADRAPDALGGPALARFAGSLAGVLERGLGRAEADVLAFTQTFDAAGGRPAGGNPAGALDRALQVLAGAFPQAPGDLRRGQGPLMGTVTST